MISPELAERCLHVDPAQIGHYVESGYMHPRIKPVDDSFRVLGPAYPVRLPTNDNTTLYYAIKRAPKGSVIVIDRMGEDRFACVGEIVVLAAKSMGMAGIVVDGPSTDTLRIKEIGLPVFSSGRSAVTNILTGLDGEHNIDVNCGGAIVHPGDIIFGDCDGVVVCPADKFEEYVEKAEGSNAREKEYIEAFEKGGYITDFINVDKLVETDVKTLLRGMMKK